MECRAKNAEKESDLLKEQLDNLKKQLTEVFSSYSFVCSWILHTNCLSNYIFLVLTTTYPLMMSKLKTLSLSFWLPLCCGLPFNAFWLKSHNCSAWCLYWMVACIVLTINLKTSALQVFRLIISKWRERNFWTFENVEHSMQEIKNSFWDFLFEFCTLIGGGVSCNSIVDFFGSHECLLVDSLRMQAILSFKKY